MAGRFAGWRRLGGDTAARPDLLDFGKKLLAYLENQRALGGAQTLSIRRVMDDGSMVMARYVGNMPEIFVRDARGGEQPTKPPVFACNPRSNDHPNGIDSDWTQVALSPRKGAWGAWFGSRAAGNAVASPKTIYTRLFKDGIKRGGNCDWRGEHGVVVSFYGPTLRYLYDPYRKPDAQYSKYVFMNGAVVLDLSEYDTANSTTTPENLVVGAALVGADLYVMQANIAPFAADPGAEFAGLVPDNAPAWISPVYPPGDTDLKLYRYAVRRVPTGALKADRAIVINDSRELLWSKTARGYVNPWVANPTATAWETFAMPDETRYILWSDYSGALSATTVVKVSEPSTSSANTKLTIIGAAVSEDTSDVSHVFDGNFGVGGNGTFNITATFAADYDASGQRVEAKMRMHSEPLPSGAWYRPLFLSVGGVEHVMLDEFGTYNFYGSQIMALDLRSKSAALLTRAADPATNELTTWLWRVIVNDEVVHASDSGYPTAFNGSESDNGRLYSYNGRNAGYFMLEMAFFYTTGADQTVLPLSPLVWAYYGTATKAINYPIVGGTATTYSATHEHVAAYGPLTTPNAEMVMVSNTLGGSVTTWLSGSGSFDHLDRTDGDGHVVPCSLIVDAKLNWIFTGVAGLHYTTSLGGFTSHRMRFPTFWASAADIPARTGVGHTGTGEPTNTYGPMWLFSTY